jgi:serine/threonine-protein kinase PRP4
MTPWTKTHFFLNTAQLTPFPFPLPSASPFPLPTEKPLMRVVQVTRATRDLTTVLLKAKAPSDDRTMVLHLANLLDKIFTLDPSKRITVKEALHHPFVSSGGGGGGGGGGGSGHARKNG